jgi:hypothetical protein
MVRAIRTRKLARTREDLDALERAAGRCERCGNDRLPLIVAREFGGIVVDGPCLDAWRRQRDAYQAARAAGAALSPVEARSWDEDEAASLSAEHRGA